MNSADPELRMLPHRTRELAVRIGVPALRKLCQKFGGITLYVPARERLHSDHAIARCIGIEKALALADEDGRRLEIPMLDQGASPLLHAQIREYRQTHSERETALHFKVTARWVRYLVAKPEPVLEEITQRDMFA